MSVWLKEPRPACESNGEKEDGLYRREVTKNPLCGEKENRLHSLQARLKAVEDTLILWQTGCAECVRGREVPSGILRNVLGYVYTHR